MTRLRILVFCGYEAGLNSICAPRGSFPAWENGLDGGTHDEIIATID